MRIRTLLRGAVLVIFFLSTLLLVIGLPTIFNSPDENANFTFAQSFAVTGNLAIIEIANPAVDFVIHPRSTLALGELIVPGSFLGLPVVYGLVGFLFGSVGILLITPFLAVLAIVAWRQVVMFWFKNESLADLAAVFLMIHPAFWLYSGRTMMHNVAFVAFLIFALYFFFRQRANYDYFRSGLMIGLALAFRTSEALWILPIVFWGLIWLYRKTQSWWQPALLIGATILILVPFGFLNQQLYGGFFSTGYTTQQPGEPVEEVVDPNAIVQEVPPGVLGYVFPFGVHELATLRHVYRYGWWLFPWMTGLTIIGVIFFIFNRRKIKFEPTWRKLLLITLVLSAWLGVVYGSWTFTDNPDPKLITLGNSYVRYWLPLFVLASPFAALAVQKLARLVKSEKVQPVIVMVIVMVAVGLSAWSVMFGPDGYLSTRQNLHEFAQKKEILLSLTPIEAIIVVDRADKFLFPDRRVVVPLRSERTYRALPELLEVAPVYYFGITLPPEDIEYLNQTKLKSDNLQIELIETVDNESLYQIFAS